MKSVWAPGVVFHFMLFLCDEFSSLVNEISGKESKAVVFLFGGCGFQVDKGTPGAASSYALGRTEDGETGLGRGWWCWRDLEAALVQHIKEPHFGVSFSEPQQQVGLRTETWEPAVLCLNVDSSAEWSGDLCQDTCPLCASVPPSTVTRILGHSTGMW